MITRRNNTGISIDSKHDRLKPYEVELECRDSRILARLRGNNVV